MQAADFLADEDFISKSSPELMRRMISPVDGDQAIKMRKTKKNKVPMGHKFVEERKENNAEVLSAHYCEYRHALLHYT